MCRAAAGAGRLIAARARPSDCAHTPPDLCVAKAVPSSRAAVIWTDALTAVVNAAAAVFEQAGAETVLALADAVEAEPIAAAVAGAATCVHRTGAILQYRQGWRVARWEQEASSAVA